MEKCNNLHELAVKVSSLPDPPDAVSWRLKFDGGQVVVMGEKFSKQRGCHFFFFGGGGGGRVYFWVT